MTTLKVREVLASLGRKGFQTKMGSHIFLVLWVNGKKTSIRTMVSHGSREVGDWEISKMAKQTKLKTPQFVNLVTCPMSPEQYLEHLKERGFEF